MPIEAERSLDQEEVLRAFREGLCGAGAGRDAACMRSGQTVLAGIVDGVDVASLGGIWCGG